MLEIEDHLAQERALVAARDQELADLEAVLATPSGLRFMRRLFDDAGLWATTFNAGAADVTAFQEGRRSLGLIYFNDVTEHFMPRFVELLKVRNAA
ncbi:MAG: hypothetical protein RLZZ524_460 [Pseudomonadota bacterium]